MAKGSVRKKGKKWYYRFYVEDASGNLVQKEYAGTESKSETEKPVSYTHLDVYKRQIISQLLHFVVLRYAFFQPLLLPL